MSGYRKVNLLFSVLGLFFITSQAVAWNATGHQIIAEIAYTQLRPEVKERVDEMVATFNREYPKINSFSQMASWPDQLHAQKIEYYSHWHYIDNPFSMDGSSAVKIADTDNAAWAIQQLKPVVSNRYANPFERARALAFLIHIAGDLHQPLHTVSRISALHPRGDLGGNLFPLTANENRSGNNLHKLWDSGLGLFSKKATPENIHYIARDITHQYILSPDGKQKITDEQQWIIEGNKIARSFVYNTPEKQFPDEDYLAKGQEIAGTRTVLAGYRLGELLNQLLE